MCFYLQSIYWISKSGVKLVVYSESTFTITWFKQSLQLVLDRSLYIGKLCIQVVVYNESHVVRNPNLRAEVWLYAVVQKRIWASRAGVQMGCPNRTTYMAISPLIKPLFSLVINYSWLIMSFYWSICYVGFSKKCVSSSIYIVNSHIYMIAGRIWSISIYYTIVDGFSKKLVSKLIVVYI